MGESEKDIGTRKDFVVADEFIQMVEQYCCEQGFTDG